MQDKGISIREQRVKRFIGDLTRRRGIEKQQKADIFIASRTTIPKFNMADIATMIMEKLKKKDVRTWAAKKI